MKRIGRKTRWSMLAFLVSVLLFALPICASTTEEMTTSFEQMPEEYGTWLDSIPEDLVELLPPELFSENAEDAAGAVMEMSILMKNTLSGPKVSSTVLVQRAMPRWKSA